jgi:hypothetical protein
MVECEMCGKKTDVPKEYMGKKLCVDCYVNVKRSYCGCRCSCW